MFFRILFLIDYKYREGKVHRANLFFVNSALSINKTLCLRVSVFHFISVPLCSINSLFYDNPSISPFTMSICNA